MRSFWLRVGWAPHAMRVFSQETEMNTQRHGKEGRVKTETELGVLHLEAKEGQGLPAATKGQERGTEQILPQSLAEGNSPATPGLLSLARTVREESVVLGLLISGNL